MANVTFLFKVIEKAVKKDIDSYLSENQLYCQFQYAYRAMYSTETALVKVHNDVMRALDQKSDVILVLLELSAAFETIDHRVLLHRLQSRLGLTGYVLKWSESYLCNSTQFVSSHSSVSESRNLLCGVPQESVLGTLLFTFYTAPLEDTLVRYGIDFMLFADDTQHYIITKNISIAQPQIELRMNEIRWMRENPLVLNDSKTEVIHFKSKFARDQERLDTENRRCRRFTFGISPQSRCLV